MAETTPIVALRARWLLPIAGPPIEGGILSIAGEWIAAVGENLSNRPPIDLGDVAILPGLVNAHTHLEFSDLAAPLGSPGDPLPTWIRRVIDYRRSHVSDSRASISRGLTESLAAGVTTIGEISTSPWQPEVETSPDVVVFQEHIGLAAERLVGREAAAREHLQMTWPQRHVRPGLSPHAPYTVHPRLLTRLVEVANQFQVPVAMHLAESREELELLRTGTGPFYELLAGMGVWSPSAIHRNTTPLDYLQTLSNAPRALVIHGNYLDGDEKQFLATARDRMSVVYCPRTHAYFAHEPYPLDAMLELGVHMALGTDSRASNPDLSLWAEAQFVAAHHSGISPQSAIELATIRGAEALGLAHELGTLEQGKVANLAIVEIGSSVAANPWQAAISSSRIRAIWRGKDIDSLVTQ